MITLDKDMVKKVGGILLAAVISWCASWIYSMGTKVAIAEERLHVVSSITTKNTQSITAIQHQINDYNAELIALVSKQDLRLTKLETLIEHVIQLERLEEK